MKNILIYMPQTWPTISTRVFKSFIDLISPENLKELGEKYEIQIKTLISGTFPLDRNRNEAVDLALSNKYEADYVLFLDGDNIFPKRTIQLMLDAISDEFPVISGLYWRKSAPYSCVQGHYSDWKGHETQKETITNMGFVDKEGNQCLFYKPLQDFDTRQPIDVSGMGIILAKTEIFKKIDMPYFAYFNSYSLGGDFTITHSSEEMLFFCKLHKAGIKVLVVPEVRCGHEVLKVIGSPEQ